MLSFFNFLPTKGLKKIFPAKGGQFVGPTGIALVSANFPLIYFDFASELNGWIGLTEIGALVCIIYAMHGWRREAR
ncbi:hypothetical protein [Rhizobium acaciae]|uniref:hypothetical protein n=1 Tax=Rhizobium acaciae TaxID=2989736 RepID=UPI0022210577|nr:hypothetical protein [Rhizobium acaciae]MCW1753057.1 hypothetical protein [Rhizobium acaciae]